METQLKKAKEALLNHQVIAFPTETVCGFGVYFDDEEAYHLLNKIKGRPEDKPYTMMLSDVCELYKYIELNDNILKIINAFMPGPITLLVKAKPGIPLWVTHGSDKVGVRVPDHPLLQQMLRYFQKPLLVPSANKSGMPPMRDMDQIKKIFKDEIAFYIDGNSNGDLPSTIVDAYGDIKIIRQGIINSEQINKVLKEKRMKISIASDHGGLLYKTKLIEHLTQVGYDIVDCGTHDSNSCHYPLFATKAAQLVANRQCLYGILICTSGEGVCISANKIHGIRCGIGYNDDVSRLMRQHNDANMIAFGQAFMDYNDVERRVDIFLHTPFEGGRHQTRVDMIKELDK